MRNSRLLHVITILTLALILAGMTATAALAYSDGGGESGTATPPAIEPQEQEPEHTEPPQAPENPVPLTPDGNLTLVDDVSGEQATDKQFVTVVSKSGNYFYLVIDRAGDTENVYFLNLVDEADLMALIEDGQTTPTTTTQGAETGEQPLEPEAPEPAPEPEDGSGMNAVLGIVLLLALIGGGAFLYFKVLKPKNAAGGSGGAEFEDFDFEDEDEPKYSPDDEGEPEYSPDDVDEPEYLPQSADDEGVWTYEETSFDTGDESETEEIK
jgi:hypothetical protein